MSYNINLGDFAKIFPMPTSIVDKHIRLASEIAIKTLLIILRNVDNVPSPQIIAQILGTDYLEDIKDAIKFWQDVGILTTGETTENREKSTTKEVISWVETRDTTTKPTERTEKEVLQTEKAQQRIEKISARKEMDRKEVMEVINKNQELVHLVHAIQDITGKPLTSIDLDCLVALYTYYGLSADYILMVVHYCFTKDKTGMRYVEKTITSWLEIGIDNHEKADEYIKKLTESKTIESNVKSALGISDRALVQKEKNYIKDWSATYGFDISMIRLAYERTVEGIGKLSFPYMDKILQNWNKNGIKTPKDATDEAFSRKNKQEQPTGKPSYNVEELDKLIYRDYFKDKD